MSEPRKNSLKNTLKEERLGEKEKGAEKEKSKSSKNTDSKGKSDAKANTSGALWGKVNRVFAFAHNERFQKIFGLTLLLFSVYLFIAFTSFAFTWEVDQDKVLGDLFSPEVRVENWLGKFGAYISYLFIYKWFGVPSYIFSFLAFVSGLRITFNLNILNLNRTYLFSFFFLVFASITFAYFFSDVLFYLGGSFGYTMCNKLNATLGTIGTGVLLVFSLTVFMVLAFNVSFDFSKKKTESVPEPIAPVEEEKPVTPVNSFKSTMEIVEEEALEEEEVEEEEIEAEEPLVVMNEVKNAIIEEVEKVELKEPLVLSAATDDVQFTVEQIGSKEEELTPEQVAEALVQQAGEFDPTLDLSSYQFPPIDLLENYGGSKEIVINTEELNANKNKILKTLGDYGIEIEKIHCRTNCYTV
jgi:DNA segregation ATPase FtsK/SpoIIIE, S-DNA-T family